MKSTSKKGYSLIELLIVIAIVAILSTIATPFFTKIRDNGNLKDAAREIAGEIQLYKQMAMTENTRYFLLYYPYNHRIYYYRRTCASNCSVNFCYQYLRNRPISEYPTVQISGTPVFNNSPDCYSGVNYLHFSPRGITGSGSVTLIHTKRGSTATISTTKMGKVNVTYDLK